MKYSLIVGAALAVLASGSALANADLAKAKNCLACHAVDNKVVGPGYKKWQKNMRAIKLQKPN
jgi:cytochrome c